MDTIILKIVGENWLTMYLAITLLKGIALITPSVLDDKIVTLLSQTYDVLRNRRAPDKID
jgi:hypothetical protein